MLPLASRTPTDRLAEMNSAGALCEEGATASSLLGLRLRARHRRFARPGGDGREPPVNRIALKLTDEHIPADSAEACGALFVHIVTVGYTSTPPPLPYLAVSFPFRFSSAMVSRQRPACQGRMVDDDDDT